MANDYIEVVYTDQFISLTLNQPETLNAFSREMILALCAELHSIKEKNISKPLILTGKGKAFSSGGNLEIMKHYVEQNRGSDYIQSIVPHVNELITLLLEYEGPTLAILNGSAVGGGFNVAMACDFRLVSEKAKFRLGFIDIGLTPATGNSFFLSKVLGIPKTMSLCLFSETFTAKELLQWGLCNELFTEETFESLKEKWIAKIRFLDPWQVKKVRELLYAGMNNSYLTQLQLELQTILEASSRDVFKDKVSQRYTEISSKKK